MADMNSFFQTLTAISIMGVFLSFVIRVSIQALVLRFFTKKHGLTQGYGKAWLAILIPTLIITLLAMLISSTSIFFLCFLWLLFFPLLIFSVKYVYKSDINISTVISLKLFLVILALVIAIAGIQTIIGTASNPLDARVPQSICTINCEFAVRTDMGFSFNSLAVKGYNIPEGKYQEKINYIISQQTFTDLNKMERGMNDKILGKLNANNCNYMEFVKDSDGIEGIKCESSSRSFFANLKNILVS